MNLVSNDMQIMLRQLAGSSHSSKDTNPLCCSKIAEAEDKPIGQVGVAKGSCPSQVDIAAIPADPVSKKAACDGGDMPAEMRRSSCLVCCDSVSWCIKFSYYEIITFQLYN
jgi:hypothetical protein